MWFLNCENIILETAKTFSVVNIGIPNYWFTLSLDVYLPPFQILMTITWCVVLS